MLIEGMNIHGFFFFFFFWEQVEIFWKFECHHFPFLLFLSGQCRGNCQLSWH